MFHQWQYPEEEHDEFSNVFKISEKYNNRKKTHVLGVLENAKGSTDKTTSNGHDDDNTGDNESDTSAVHDGNPNVTRMG
jgi:hypothetical protein